MDEIWKCREHRINTKKGYKGEMRQSEDAGEIQTRISIEARNPSALKGKLNASRYKISKRDDWDMNEGDGWVRDKKRI